jgi:putative membrane protein
LSAHGDDACRRVRSGPLRCRPWTLTCWTLHIATCFSATPDEGSDASATGSIHPGFRVAPRIASERGGTLERAEAVVTVLVAQMARAAVGCDRHPADGIDREGLVARTGAPGSVDLDQLGNVAKPLSPLGLELDALQSTRRVTGSRGQEDLVTLGRCRNPGGEVDCGAEPVAVTQDRGTGVHPDAHDREARAFASILDQREAQANRIRGLWDPDHHGVADRLHLFGVERGQQLAHGAAEARDQVGSPLVPVSLGEGHEAGEIGEQKSLALVLLGWDHHIMSYLVAALLLRVAQWDHHDWDGWWIMMAIGMILFWTVVVLGIVWIVRELTGRHPRASRRDDTDDPLAILDRRLAEGAISSDEYRERREILINSRSTAADGG